MKTHIHLVIEEDLKKGLEIVAKAQNRSVNNLIASILTDYVSTIGDKAKEILLGYIMNLSDEEKSKLMNEYGRNTKGRKNDNSRTD